MDTSSWLQLFGVCLAGAMSPGPSLGLVVHNSLIRGRLCGISTSIGHGIGISLWALFTAVGVAELVTNASGWWVGIQISGAMVLAYIGARTLLGSGRLLSDAYPVAQESSRTAMKAALEGFLISILNPKIAVFFLAIFSQFAGSDSDWSEVGLMGLSAGLIDGLWYVSVAVAITGGKVSEMVRSRQTLILRFSGFVLLLVALNLLVDISRSTWMN